MKMRSSLWFWIALAWLLAVPSARAAITCTIGSPGVSINYASAVPVSLQSFFSVTCTREFATDPTSFSYSVTTDNGRSPNGMNNNATNSPSGATLRYDFYTASGCGTQWKGNLALSDTITWSTTGTITKQGTFWTCMATGQTASASGLYSDTAFLTLKTGNNQIVATGTVAVSIYAPALCTITRAPGNMTLTYAAFGAQIATSTTFDVNCTLQMPYTMATDVPEGVLAGLRYTLGVSASTANGTGAPQMFSITATVPAGQAGTCATSNCSASRTHTLTISY